jgi:Replication-relaxation
MWRGAKSSILFAQRSTNVPFVGCGCYIDDMDDKVIARLQRRPRFRRAAEPPSFRVTDNDLEIIRQIARHRFLRSTHVAALVGRSLDRTNDRLSRLFHAGYIDRPRAQLDYYPTSGSAPIVYALADLGAQLLGDRLNEVTGSDWSRKNREAGRAFIDHQLEIVDFLIALQLAVHARSDIRLIRPDEIVANFPGPTRSMRNPTALRADELRKENARVPHCTRSQTT